ncbi:DNA translocase FtsK [Robertmurraya kyonggiensis]|uniref:DNA translocase FtsK n=1 Tax=Robertmurraya kyonggiensis TaxID=1037680 RepID=A0A4U1D0W6_9BACI|nr:DNA translocase FtsK [Robertmurraya kyonggiensis]TKC15852.1 DNA translocase FtsK [Robertmurraya kyonggiensis]
MSWFKKLFQSHNSEEDDYIEEARPEHKEGRPDVDARVIYQYPKGQFRFPLIPDEERGGKRTRPTGESRRTTQPSQEPKRPERRAQPSLEKGQPSVKKVVTPPKAKPVQKKNYSNGPFRPTEIPSPIYGYERPPRRTKPVEVELNGFTSVKNEEEQVVPVSKPISGGESNSVQRMERDSLVPSQVVNEPKIDIVAQTPVDHENTNEFERESIPFTKVEPSLVVEIDSKPELPTYNENDFVTEIDSVVEQEHEVIELVEEIVEIEDYYDELETITEEHDEVAALEFEREVTTEIVYEVQETPIQTTEAILEDNVILQSELEVEEQDEQVEDLESERPVEKKRSHIPFNVLMLSQDKRKLENKAKETFAPAISEVSVTLEESKPDEIVTELNTQEVKSVETLVLEDTEEVSEDSSEEAYYVFPSVNLLKPPVFKSVDKEWLELQEHQLNETLFNFNVRASVANVTQGPSVTRFEVRPEPGVKVNKITNLADDIKLSLAAKDIRMEAPIPGTHMIGIEVPNESSRPVFISEIINSQEFIESQSPLTAVLGLDISGEPIVTDLRKMPHGLIAGATGSGKSVCINSILVSLLYKANPNEVKLLLIDPKMVELAPYNQIPHLVSPVITDVKAATAALKWAVEEMERRYELFAHAGVRDISRFNEIAEQEKRYSVKLPYIVIVIDELADLMMMSPADVEEAICRIAQKARACGIHLIIATQRPSVDVITGLIKANVPTRIAFSVSSQIDSRTIIDISGAERLLGRGDMLFLENGSSKPVRLQGTYVTDEEIDAIVNHVRREQSPQYLFEQEELLKKAIVSEEEDELFYEACEFIIEQGGASTSSLQRKFKIGYNRAARLIDMMEEQGFISEARGSKPRDVLITESELESFQDE